MINKLETLKTIKTLTKDKKIDTNTVNGLTFPERERVCGLTRGTDVFTLGQLKMLDENLVNIINFSDAPLDLVSFIDNKEDMVVFFKNYNEEYDIVCSHVNSNKSSIPNLETYKEYLMYCLYMNLVRGNLELVDIPVILGDYNFIKLFREKGVRYYSDRIIKCAIELCYLFGRYSPLKYVENVNTFFNDHKNKKIDFFYKFVYEITQNIGYEFSYEKTEQLFEFMDLNESEEFYNVLSKFLKSKTKTIWLYNLLENRFVDYSGLKTLADAEIDDNTTLNPYKVLYSGSLFNISQNNEIKLDRTTQKSILNQKRKKAFLRLIENKLEYVKKRSYRNMLFEDDFNKIVNINTLNESNLKDLNNITDLQRDAYTELVEYLKSNSITVDLTFNEFKSLINKKHNYCSIEFMIELYLELIKKESKIDRRLKIFSQLPLLSQDDFKLSNKKKLASALSDMLLKKPLDLRISELNNKLLKVTKIQYLKLFFYWDNLSPYIMEIKTGFDIDFVISNIDLIDELKSIEKAKEKQYFSKESFRKISNQLKLNGDFILSNKEGIFAFMDQGLDKVYLELSNNTKLSSSQRKNLDLLVKAEFANKLKDIKYIDKDFDLEIGISTSPETRTCWKENMSIIGGLNFQYQETDSFNDLIRIGQLPTDTCLNWNNGKYVNCLLSNFDTNKKLLVSIDRRTEKINSRAIIRLTKISNASPEVKNNLSFIDISEVNDSDSGDNISATDVKEELALFLEVTYSNLDDSQKEIVENQFIKLALNKAKLLNAKLVVSSHYDSSVLDEFAGVLEEDEVYTFISYSKNGCQYLDSLSGNATASSEGSYKKQKLYVQK